MSPFHQGYVRALRTTTALQSSCAWLVSENVRHIRDINGEPYEVAIPDFYGNILAEAAVARTAAKLKEMH